MEFMEASGPFLLRDPAAPLAHCRLSYTTVPFAGGGVRLADIQLRTFKEVDLVGGTVIEAIPSVGLVSTIAATYMLTNLPVDQVCALDSEDFPPLPMGYKSLPTFPVRSYADAEA